MKLKVSLILLITLLSFSCGKNTNSDEFIEKATGRYLFNSDELITVYFKEKTLFLEWRGADAIKPLKTDENTFFVKEMNEKIQFLTNPEDNNDYIVLVPKEENDTIVFNYRKLGNNEKTPNEYLNNHEFDKALKAYILIQQKDSLDPALNEGNFNRLGYNKLRSDNFEEAKQIFKINMELYPNSSNVYDSYAEALRKSGDTVQAIEFYKKSIAIDSGNRDAKRFIEKYDTKE